LYTAPNSLISHNGAVRDTVQWDCNGSDGKSISVI